MQEQSNRALQTCDHCGGEADRLNGDGDCPACAARSGGMRAGAAALVLKELDDAITYLEVVLRFSDDEIRRVVEYRLSNGGGSVTPDWEGGAGWSDWLCEIADPEGFRRWQEFVAAHTGTTEVAA